MLCAILTFVKLTNTLPREGGLCCEDMVITSCLKKRKMFNLVKLLFLVACLNMQYLKTLMRIISLYIGLEILSLINVVPGITDEILIRSISKTTQIVPQISLFGFLALVAPRHFSVGWS